MINKEVTQAKVNQIIGDLIPTILKDSSVCLVNKYGNDLRGIGSGTLFRIANRKFVITAGHVVKANQQTIGILTAGNGIAYGKGGIYSDDYDVAIFEIVESESNRLDNVQYANLSHVYNKDIPVRAVFTMLGYPSIWVAPDSSVENGTKVKMMQYTAYRQYPLIAGCNEKIHLLMTAGTDEMTNDDGTKFVYRSIDGTLLKFPTDIGGVSGCAIWQIGDLDIPLKDWSKTAPQLVGVETGVYSKEELIQGTKWIAVNTLIRTVYVDLRPIIDNMIYHI